MIQKASPIKGKPLVSAVIAAHNEEKYVGKAIQSLIEQAYKPIEIIVVDNSSTDSTYEVMKEFKKKYPQIKILKRTGFQRGPGVAWNLGARHAKGKIIMTYGADLFFGKDYMRDMIKPILRGETIGTMHREEKIANLENIWARAFCIKRATPGKTTKLFSLIRKDSFFKYGPLDPKFGYADDRTIYFKHGIESLLVNAEVWHHNPASFIENWRHDIWVGKSNKKPWIMIVALPLIPIHAIYKTIEHLVRKDFYWKLIFFLPVFYSLKYAGYFVGAVKRLFISEKV